MIEFPDEMSPQIEKVKADLLSMPGIQIHAEPHCISLNGLYLDPVSLKVIADEKEVALTLTEFNILAMMARQSGRVFTYEQISGEVCRQSQRTGDDQNSAYCLIRNLRRKIEKRSRYIHTVYGIGYKFQILSEE